MHNPSENFYPLDTSLPLFIQRGEGAMVPLFIQGSLQESGSLNLFIVSNNALSSGMDLFCVGGTDSGNQRLNLYTHGAMH